MKKLDNIVIENKIEINIYVSILKFFYSKP